MSHNSSGKKEWYGCEEDCFNCVYADCIRPDYLMNSPYEKRMRVSRKKQDKYQYMTDEEFEYLLSKLLARHHEERGRI